MTNPTLLISGASVAGPALAYLLQRRGFDVTIVERAATPRASGYAVDFRGEAFDVLDQLGILAEVRGLSTEMRGTDIVDENGKKTGELPTEVFAGDLEVLKRDLTSILYRITKGDVEYLFGDSIATITQDADGVDVGFEQGGRRRFDFVAGADGVYSRVRRLAFGAHEEFVRHLGMSGVGFTTSNHLGLAHRGLLWSAPGRAVYLFSGADPARMTVSLSFATDTARYDLADRHTQEGLVRDAFIDARWEVPLLLDGMSSATDFLFSSACQIELDRWSNGRIGLLGDAGYCAAPTSGMGTSQALIGAARLADCLAGADNHTAAFESYERGLRPYITENQAQGRAAVSMFGG